MDDSFLTVIEDEKNIRKALRFLDIFCLASKSSIQWHKTQCYRQSFFPAPPWLLQFGWKWLNHGEPFRFLSIHFAFQGSPIDLWNAVLARIEKKISH